MTRQVLTDGIWTQLKKTMKFHGCHSWSNDRSIMEAILWKLRTGAPWRDIPKELCPWKTATIVLIGGPPKVCGRVFF